MNNFIQTFTKKVKTAWFFIHIWYLTLILVLVAIILYASPTDNQEKKVQTDKPSITSLIKEKHSTPSSITSTPQSTPTVTQPPLQIDRQQLPKILQASQQKSTLTNNGYSLEYPPNTIIDIKEDRLKMSQESTGQDFDSYTILIYSHDLLDTTFEEEVTFLLDDATTSGVVLENINKDDLLNTYQSVSYTTKDVEPYKTYLIKSNQDKRYLEIIVVKPISEALLKTQNEVLASFKLL